MESGATRYYGNDALCTDAEDAKLFSNNLEALDKAWEVNNWYNVKSTEVLSESMAV